MYPDDEETSDNVTRFVETSLIEGFGGGGGDSTGYAMGKQSGGGGRQGAEEAVGKSDDGYYGAPRAAAGVVPGTLWVNSLAAAAAGEMEAASSRP